MASFTKAVLDGIVGRLSQGTSSLGKEAKALGMNYRTSLIAALRAHMGREAYDALISSRRPATGGHTPTNRPRPDDKGLELLSSMSKADGWSWRHVPEHPPVTRYADVKDSKGQKARLAVRDSGDSILIMVDPSGVEYVRADEFEKADLLRRNVLSENGPPMRFVKYAHSNMRGRLEKAHAHGTALLEKGEAALKRKREKANTAPEDIAEEQRAVLAPERAAKAKGKKKAKAKGKKKSSKK